MKNSKPLNWEVLAQMLKLLSTCQWGRQVTDAVLQWAASPDTTPTPDAQLKENLESTNPRIIINDFSCCRRMKKLGEWTFKKKTTLKYKRNKATSGFGGGRRECWVCPLPSTAVGWTPQVHSIPGWWRRRHFRSPKSGGPAPSKVSSRPPLVFALQLVLGIPSDKKVGRNNV